ncbi:8105_t:CDS:1, partial [Gigaspora margarita]
FDGNEVYVKDDERKGGEREYVHDTRMMMTDEDSKDCSREMGRDEVEAEMEFVERTYGVVECEKEIGDEKPIDEIRKRNRIVVRYNK